MEINFLNGGAYGAVFSPPFPSSSGETFDESFVGKVFFEDSDNDEWEISLKLQKIENKKQKYFIYPKKRNVINYPTDDSKASMTLRKIIEKNGKRKKEYIQFIMENGGQSLKEYINKTYAKYHLYRKVYYTQKNLSRKTLVNLLENTFYGIKRLVDYKYVHQDIKEDNITVLKNERTRLIDFGLTVSFEDYYNPQKNFLLNKTYHSVSPPEIYIFQLYSLSDVTFEKVCEWSEVNPSIAGNPTEFEKFIKDLQDINETLLTQIKNFIPDEHITLFLKCYKIGDFKEIIDLDIDLDLEKLLELEPFKQEVIKKKMEYYTSHNFAEKCDIYSLGMTIARLYNNLKIDENDDLKVHFRKLVRGMIDINPITRIDIYQAIELVNIIKNL